MARLSGPIWVALVLVTAITQAQESISYEPEENQVVFASDQDDSAGPVFSQAVPAPSRIRPVTSSAYGGANFAPQATTVKPMPPAYSAAPANANWDAASADSQYTFSQPGACCNGNCADGGCCNGACGDCCNPCWPRWYVQAEAMFLWRNNDTRVQPVIISSATSATVFDTRSADFDTGIGPRALIGLRTSDCTAWECQYFSALDMSGSSSVSSPGQLNAAGSFPQLLGWDAIDGANVRYSSELHNVEINHVHTWGELSLLGGFRFVRLSEDYDLGVTQSFGSDAYNVHTENNMYGAQLGGRWRECRGKFFWDFTGKAGIFGNDANQSQYLTSAGGAQLQRNFTSFDSSVAFVGDLNLSIGFRMNQVWAVRCGYNVLWIDQVALAANQLDFAINSGAGRTITSNGDVILHGINVGLEGRW